MKIGELLETVSTGQGGGSAGRGGGQMVGGPTTYAQEYGMFKSKGPRRITAMTNEALDSSYPYEGLAISGRYTFETEDGVFYKVYFQGKDLVEIAFSAILPGEEENFRPDKTAITGTGNSRKVFGTVVKIVQEYVEAHKPKALYFISSDEPSRLRLYQTMTDQVGKALPDYYAVKPTDLGTGVVYMLHRKKTEVTSETLDSSYPYEFKNAAYYFTTDNGNDYRVTVRGINKAEVEFMSRDENGQFQNDNITGTGDSRTVFGTVIKIVKDYVEQTKPNEVSFLADNNEPSRVKLYKAFTIRAAQALPNYQSLSPISQDDNTTEFRLRRLEKAT